MKKKAFVVLSLMGAMLLTGCSSELGNRMSIAGLNTIMGLCVVFVVLILISLIISLFQFIPKIEAALAKKKAPEQTTTETKVSEEPAPEADYVDDLELVAVISAAIAAYTGTSADGFVVRSIRRR